MVYKSKINGNRYYTVAGLEITENVLTGKTKVFKHEESQEAEAFAEQHRSYTYPVNYKAAKGKKIKSYGYAVPN